MRISAVAVFLIFSVAPALAAQLDQSAHQGTCDSDCRIKALEQKTNYYTKKTKKFHAKYRKSLAGDGSCIDGQLEFTTQDTVSGGLAYVWFSIDVQGGEASNIIYVFPDHENPGPECVLLPKGDGTGFTTKTFCSLDVVDGDHFNIWLSDYSQTCDHFDAVDITMKVTNIAIPEPQ